MQNSGVAHYVSGGQRSYDEARQRGTADLVEQMINSGQFAKFNVEPRRVRRLVGYVRGVRAEFFNGIAGLRCYDFAVD